MFRFAGELDALPFIMDPATHKVRRGIVDPMFPPRTIKDFSPLALQTIKGALKKIGDSYETGKPVSLKRLESNFAVRQPPMLVEREHAEKMNIWTSS
jgi:hypothetical protein